MEERGRGEIPRGECDTTQETPLPQLDMTVLRAYIANKQAQLVTVIIRTLMVNVHKSMSITHPVQAVHLTLSKSRTISKCP